MPLKFRLKGLAETFVDSIRCPTCGHNGGEEGDEGFRTDHTRVTFDGIVVVIECAHCETVFVPREQRMGIVDSGKLRIAVVRDSEKSGLPVLSSVGEVRLDVERLMASRSESVH